MQFDFFIGIDVSKNELDFSVVKSGTELFHLKTTNSLEGIKSFIKIFKSKGYILSNALFCMEHTGIYNNPMLGYCTKQKAAMWLESAMQIKKSSGLQRGKNDRVDALRIAMFAYKNRDEVKLWEPRRYAIQRLKYLLSVRSRTVNVLKQLRVPIKEEQEFADRRVTKGQLNKRAIEILKIEIKDIENEIRHVIKEDKELKRIYEQIVSVQGVGMITATNIIVTTNEFKDITEAKKFACYAGVAPFEHSSGSSIRGKTRVSTMANKTIKTLLHMVALGTIRRDGELKKYFERKVAEGKNKMSVINAIRNKLIHRIFACVMQNRKYEKNYTHALA